MQTPNVTKNTKDDRPVYVTGVLFQFRMTKERRKALRVAAAHAETTVSDMTNQALKEYLDKRGLPTELEVLEDEPQDEE